MPVILLSTMSVAYAENTWSVFLSPYEGNEKTELFRPLEIPIDSGDKIIWKNQDSTSHKIVSGVPQHPDFSGKFFSTKVLDPGESTSTILDSKGYAAYYYYCEIHPWYTGKIFFEDNPNMYDSTKDISYEIKNNDSLIVKGEVDFDLRTTTYEIMVFDSKNNLIFQTLDKFKEDATFEQNIDISNLIWSHDEKYTLKLAYGVPSESKILQLEIPIRDTSEKLKHIALDGCSDSQSDSDFIFENTAIPNWYKQSLCWFVNGQVTQKEVSDSLEFFQRTY